MVFHVNQTGEAETIDPRDFRSILPEESTNGSASVLYCIECLLRFRTS